MKFFREFAKRKVNSLLISLMCVTNSSLLLVRLSIPPLACVIGVERGRGSGTVGDREEGKKGGGSGFRRGLP